MSIQHIGYYPRFRKVIPVFGVGYQCVTHPFAMGLNPFDLHALDAPLALILSQDQTLKNDEILFSCNMITTSCQPLVFLNYKKNCFGLRFLSQISCQITFHSRSAGWPVFGEKEKQRDPS